MEKKTMVADMILGLIFALDTIARFWLYSFFFLNCICKALIS